MAKVPEKPTPRLTVTAIKVNVGRSIAAVVKNNEAVKATSAALAAAREVARTAPVTTQPTGGAGNVAPQGS